MNTVLAEPRRVDIRYNGWFAEPVFRVLGNPADLYGSFLRHLAPYGATLDGLITDFAVLARTNVGCHLTSGTIRVWVDRLEVWLRDVHNQKEAERLIQAFWRATAEVDESLHPISHVLELEASLQLKNETFSSYIQRFIKVPQNLSDWRTAIRFSNSSEGATSTESIFLEKAADIPEGLFLHSRVHIADADLTPDRPFEIFWKRFRSQFRAITLDVPLGIE